jgi:hypothetical protein
MTERAAAQARGGLARGGAPCAAAQTKNGEAT